MLLSRPSLSFLLKRFSIHSGSAPVDWSIRLSRFTSWIYSPQLEGRPFTRPLWESCSSCDDFTGSSCKKDMEEGGERRGEALCTLNLIAAWFDTLPMSAVSFYLIEAFFKEIKRCIHFSSWSHLYLFMWIKERQEETTKKSPVLHMCGPWQQKMDFYVRPAAVWRETLAMLTHYKE